MFTALAEFTGRYPDWRIGQLIANVAGWADVDVWDMDNDQLLAAVRSHLRQMAQPPADA